MTRCPQCAVESDWLCHRCEGSLYRMLYTIATLVPELHTELTKQTKKGVSNGRGGNTEEPLIYSPEASDLTLTVHETLYAWAHTAGLVTLDLVSSSMLANMIWVNHHTFVQMEDVTMFIDEMGDLRDHLVKLADLPTEKVFLGTCAGCGAAVMGDLGCAYVACRCGVLVAAEAAKRDIAATIHESWITSKEVLTYLKRTEGLTVSKSLLATWAKRGLIRREDGYYHVGDVIARAKESHDRRRKQC